MVSPSVTCVSSLHCSHRKSPVLRAFSPALAAMGDLPSFFSSFRLRCLLAAKRPAGSFAPQLNRVFWNESRSGRFFYDDVTEEKSEERRGGKEGGSTCRSW